MNGNEDRGYFHRYIGLPFEALILQGSSTRQLSFAVAIGVTFGLFLIGLSILSLLPPSLFPVSSRAVVNARVSLIRAPIPGEVGEVTGDVGAFVKSGEALCVVRNDRVPQMQDLE